MSKHENTQLNFLQNRVRIIFIILIIFNFYAASFALLHNQINFHTDIARDFLLLREIEEKKIVLIGGSTSIAGLYHGPIWLYFNFPAYYLSGGDPNIVTIFKILAVIFFTIVNFIIVKRLFGETTAYLFTIIVSTILIPWGQALNHPEFAFFLMPTFFYTFWRYIKSLNAKYLCTHVIVAGIIIQLEIATGAPLFLISTIYISYFVFTKRKFGHFAAFLLILLPLSSYLLFDIRHNFLQFKSFIKYTLETSSNTPYINIILDRIRIISTIGFMVPSYHSLNIASTVISLFFVVKIVSKKHKYRQIYTIILYFVATYFFLTLFSRHLLLTHQYYPLVPIVLAMFLSLINTKYKIVMVFIVLICLVFNGYFVIKYLKESSNVDNFKLLETSWPTMNKISQDVFRNNTELEFGYFIYSPDKLAYVPKYGMVYATKKYPEKVAHYFQKKPITYVISAPAPLTDPRAKYFTDDWWIENSIKISNKPVSVMRYSNGYTVKRYELSPDEISIPFDQFEDNGIFFR